MSRQGPHSAGVETGLGIEGAGDGFVRLVSNADSKVAVECPGQELEFAGRCGTERLGRLESDYWGWETIDQASRCKLDARWWLCPWQ